MTSTMSDSEMLIWSRIFSVLLGHWGTASLLSFMVEMFTKYWFSNVAFSKSSIATLPLSSFIRGGIEMLLQDLVNLRANFQKSWLLLEE